MPRDRPVGVRPSVANLIGSPGDAVESAIGSAADANLLTEAEGNSSSPRHLSRETTCSVLQEVAAEYDLPEPLFARLIWQESKFRADVVSPVGAQGIAQFMPATAEERGLDDPFDPVQALPASAAFLRDLVRQFGNFGLAAAAYNGGPGRVSRWLSGKGGLPTETRNYVIQITGRTAEHWATFAAAEPHPEATAVSDCKVQPLRQAIAEIRDEERFRREGYPSVALANKAQGRTADGTPKPPKRPQATWVALLTGTWSEKKARSVYANLQKKYPKVLGNRAPKVKIARTSSKKTKPKAHVRLVAESRKEAEELCKRLKEGGGACVVKQES